MNQMHSRYLLRIIDVELNRIGEGLRVLEETSRFILCDTNLSVQLKELRHQLSPRDIEAKIRYISTRDSQNDIGSGITSSLQHVKRDMLATVVANSRRAEESLRVMEEISKVEGVGLDGQTYQDARFKLYSIEKELVSRLSRRNISAKIHGLYVVIDSDSLKGINVIEVASSVLSGGVKILQLRDKTTGKRELLELALVLKDLCARNESLLIINDYMDIALASGADGLHVGQQDLPIKSARAFLPVDKLIGCSVTDVVEAKIAIKDGADYLACGAIYATRTKPDSIVLGLESLREIKNAVSVPLVAIGGININNISDIFCAGADAAAVISAIVLARSPESAAREMLERIDGCHG
jgi:thiamine-phosphate pyrophosphorylase